MKSAPEEVTHALRTCDGESDLAGGGLKFKGREGFLGEGPHLSLRGELELSLVRGNI